MASAATLKLPPQQRPAHGTLPLEAHARDPQREGSWDPISPGQRARLLVSERNAALGKKAPKESTDSGGAPKEKADFGGTLRPAVRPARDDELQEVATLLNKRMVEVIPDPRARSWYKMFVHMDDDCSGKIDYHELEDMLRNELHVPRGQISDAQLQSVWRALDEDSSGYITTGEFGSFMRRGKHVHEDGRLDKDRVLKANRETGNAMRAEWQRRVREVRDQSEAAQVWRHGRASEQRAAEAEVPESVARRVLQANRARAARVRGERDERLSRTLYEAPGGSSTLQRANDSELEYFSRMLHARMKEIITDPAARSWYKMFVHLDDDCSGKISFWELDDMIRNELKVPLSTVSDSQLKAVWRSLDSDSSGHITSGEFGHFMRLGEDTSKPGAPPRLKLQKSRATVGARMREHSKRLLQAHGERLAAEQSARSERALQQHDVMWGLCAPAASTKPWRSPRALVV